MRRNGLIKSVTILGLIVCLFFILWGGSFVAAEEESALQRIKRTGVVRFGWAPFLTWTAIDEKTNKLVGMGPDIAEEMAKALGNVKIEWVADSWATIIAGIQASKFDIAIPLGVSLERAMVVAYTKPLMLEANTFLINKKDAAKFKTHDDINQPGVKVSVSLGSTTDIYLTRLFKKPEITRYRSTPESLLALVHGKVDAWANTGTQLAAALKSNQDLRVVKGSFFLGKICMGIKQGDQIFLNWLNCFIDDTKETGTLERIYQKYGQKGETFFD